MVKSIVIDLGEENCNKEYEGATNARILPVSATPTKQKTEERIVGKSAKFLHWIGYEEIFSSQVFIPSFNVHSFDFMFISVLM